MCDPVTATIAVASAAVGMGSTYLAYKGKKQAAAENTVAANTTAATNYNEISQRRVQIDARNSEDTLTALIDRASAQGLISSSASAFGTGASTVTQLSNAEDFAAGRAASIAQLNTEEQRQQLNTDKAGIAIRQRSQINSVKAPSKLSLALGFAEDALAGASTYTSLGGKF